MSDQPAVDLGAVKDVQQRTWSEGDFSVIGTLQQIVAENLCEAVDLRAGARVLDVACGSGNASIAAARRFCEVVGVDYVPALLERARERAAAEGLEIGLMQGDAEQLPVEDGSFDVVLSTFGAMFAPDHQRAADELLRVCRSGGRIGMANWTPDGFVGQMFAVTAASGGDPAPGVQPPSLWGTTDHLGRLLGDRITDLRVNERDFTFRFRSVEHWLELFATYFGPIRVALQELDDWGRERLRSELRELVARHNRAPEAMVVPAGYLEIVAIRT